MAQSRPYGQYYKKQYGPQIRWWVTLAFLKISLNILRNPKFASSSSLPPFHRCHLSPTHSPPLLFLQALKPWVFSGFFNIYLAFELVCHLLTYIEAQNPSPLDLYGFSQKRKGRAWVWSCDSKGVLGYWKQHLKPLWAWKWGRLLNHLICGYIVRWARVLHSFVSHISWLEVMFSRLTLKS